MKKIFICLSAIVFMAAVTVFGAAKIDKQGFDITRNIDFKQGNILYHIPDYYSEFGEDGDSKVTYAKEADKIEAKIIFSNADGADYSNKAVIKEAKDAIVKSINDTNKYVIQFYCDTLVAGEQGFIINYLEKETNNSGWYVLVFNETDRNFQTIDFLEASNAKYSYTSDFLKILMSAEKYEEVDAEEATTEAADNRVVVPSSEETTAAETEAPTENADDERNSRGIVEQESEAVETTTAAAEEFTYILNTNTKKFHYPDCNSVRQMKDKNKKEFTGTREEVISMGYKPCGNCRP